MINAKDRMIIALDFPTMEAANSKGEMIEYLRSKGKKIFLDLKFHDIPNTTAMASVFAAKQDVFMFNVHASGGRKMMSKVVEEVKKVNPNRRNIQIYTITIRFSSKLGKIRKRSWT